MASPKKTKFDNARNDYGSEQDGQPFGTYDDDVFAALEVGQVDSDNLPIDKIWADPTQPRNIIPREIHSGWTGNPAAMPEILGAWIEAIYDAGVDLPIEDILRGKGRGSDKEHSLSSDEAIVQKFLPILNLAAQIRDVGLKQRIGVIETGKTAYRIIYGERRWTAFHLLKMFLGEGYSSIPAQVAKVTEWELAKIQAAENFHQSQLNAISKARQLAKLLILARKDSQDPAYDSWEKLVAEGGCNRPYFAQVADGNKHPIPYGMGSEFERTLNISTTQMRQYRALLRMTGDWEIDNRLWDLGDARDWSENFMRDIYQSLDISIVRQIFAETEDPEEMLREAVSSAKASKNRNDRYASQNEDTVTTVTVSTDPTPDEAAPKAPFTASTGTATPSTLEPFKYGDRVKTPDGDGEIITIVGDTALVRLDKDRRSIRFGFRQLQHAPKVESWFNRHVQNVSGGIGVVVVDFGDEVEVDYADGGRGRIQKQYLSDVSKEDYEDARRRHYANAINRRLDYVRGAQGIAKIVRNIDSISFGLQFPDGEEFVADKTGWVTASKEEWDAAVAALANDNTGTGLKFREHEIVFVRQGMAQVEGTIRYIKADSDKPYGVFLHDSQSTHYYAEFQLSHTRDEAPSAGKALSLKDVSYRETDRIFKLNDKAFEGLEVQMGWVKLHRDIMQTHGKNYFMLLAYDGRTGHIAIDHDADKLASALRTVKHPFFEGMLGNAKYVYVDWHGIMNVLDTTGAHYIMYRPPTKVMDALQRDVDRMLANHGGGSDNVNSLHSASPSGEETKPRDWVGKPATVMVEGRKVPVFVQEFVGAGMLKVVSDAGAFEVHFSELEAVASDDTRLSDFFKADEIDHSDLLGKRVRLDNGDVGKVTQVYPDRVVLEFSEHITGGAQIGSIVEVLGDDEAEETKAITDVDTLALLRHIGHVTRRENTILNLLMLTRQNAIAAHQDGKLEGDLQLIRDSVKSGFQELLEEFEGILTAVLIEAEEAIKE